MGRQKYYSIGEVSKICNISKKTLRFYDKIGIISPDLISEENNYRFYSRETLLFIPVIKYFKQMGFRLEEMKGFLEGNTYTAYEKGFQEKLEELKQEEKRIHVAHISVKDWYELIMEADCVVENNATEVSVKYMDALTTCYLEQEFGGNYMEAIINIDWTNYLEEIGQNVRGAVFIWFADIEEKMEGRPVKSRIFQEMIPELGHGGAECKEYPVMTVGGCMMAACYHVGPHETIGYTYEKIFNWAEKNGYQCSNESIERFVTDYWATKKHAYFVTEVLVKVSKKR